MNYIFSKQEQRLTLIDDITGVKINLEVRELQIILKEYRKSIFRNDSCRSTRVF